MSLPDQSPSFTAKDLPTKKYSSLQEFAQDFVKGLEIVFPPGFLSRKGEKGDVGTTVKVTPQRFPVISGSNKVDVGFDASEHIVNVVSTDATPTVGYLCLSGTLVVLTGNAPTDGYTVVVTKIERPS